MLKDVAGIRRVVIACGFVDLRKGIDGLAQIIGARYDLNPFEKGTLFLFCKKWIGQYRFRCTTGGRLSRCCDKCEWFRTILHRIF